MPISFRTASATEVDRVLARWANVVGGGRSRGSPATMHDVEWNPAKDASNRRKHGIGFVDTATVCNDPLRLVEDSIRPEHGEERRKTIGRMGAIVVVVVISTDRDGRQRLIFAQRASQDERRRDDPGAATG